MRIKCKTKSSRVKGVAFHPRLHFLLASMHCGDIQMWDYLNSTLLEVFTEHEGPVRGIDFHIEQPLFATGGDDTTVIVWDFTQRRKLFTLTGHFDYIRTVQFHTKYPWLLSACDDQTLRIWNWQARCCLAVVSGHNHYVMSGLFHPSHDLIISSSLDHTARIWNMTQLVEKNCTFQTSKTIPHRSGTVEIDISNVSDVVCMHTITGHTSGLNYAIFGDKNIAITASDDLTVRIWRYNDSTFYQTNVLRAHENNVTYLVHATDYLLSTSEDHTIRIWDYNTFTLVHTYVMEDNRFWTISKSRHNNYIAAGHDAGLIVFKLYKERPLVDIVEAPNNDFFLYYAWNQNIYASMLFAEIKSFHEDLAKSYTEGEKGKTAAFSLMYYKWLELNPIIPISTFVYETPLKLVFQAPCGAHLSKREHLASVQGEKHEVVPLKLLANPYYHNTFDIMLLYVKKTKFVEVMSYKKGQRVSNFARECTSATFLNTTQVLTVGKTITVYDLQGNALADLSSLAETLLGDTAGGDAAAATERDLAGFTVYTIRKNVVLFHSPKNQMLYLYNADEARIVNTVAAPYKKLFNVIVNKLGHICCAFANFVVIYDSGMNRMTFKHQVNRVKSAVWHEDVAVVYTTYNQVSPANAQIHYLMLNGSFGVLTSFPTPTYLLTTRRANGKIGLVLMTREHRVHMHYVDAVDYELKRALMLEDHATANSLVKAGELFGRFTCSYLINSGNYDLARKLLGQDHANKFHLAIQFGNLRDALSDAKKLNHKATWSFLGDAALELGNVTTAELAYQKSKQYDKLTLLYIVTGDFGKLRKMLNMCKIHNNRPMALLHGRTRSRAALYLGDMEELSSVLTDGGNPDLAQICNNTYLINQGETTANGGNGTHGGKYLLPPKPVNRLEGDMLNWSVKAIEPTETRLRDVVELFRERQRKQQLQQEAQPEQQVQEIPVEPEHFEDAVEPAPEQAAPPQAPAPQLEVGADPFGEILGADGHELPADAEDIWEALEPRRPETTGEERMFKLLKEGNHTTAMNAIVELHQDLKADLLVTAVPTVSLALSAYASLGDLAAGLNLAGCLEPVYEHFQNAEFEQCFSRLRGLLGQLFVYRCMNVDVNAWVETCRWYALALLLETAREEQAQADPRRALELAAYLTCCRLRPKHQYLVIRKTIGLMWKAKNFRTAAALVDRLLALDPAEAGVDQTEMEKARKIHALCIQKGTEEHALSFGPEDFAGVELCSVSLVRLGGMPTVSCFFCGATALRKYLRQYCSVCQLVVLL